MPASRMSTSSELSLDAIEKIQDLLAIHKVAISGLGYYPNPLTADRAEAEVAVNHLRKVIDAAAALGVGQVNSFIGRDPALSVEDNWPRFLETWRPLIAHAEAKNVRDRHRELPDALHPRRMARRQEPGDHAGHLAADVQRHPQRLLRPELRSLAHDLAADGLPGADL